MPCLLFRNHASLANVDTPFWQKIVQLNDSQVPLFTVCGLAPSFPLLVITSNSSRSLSGLVAAALPLFGVEKLLKPSPVPLKPLLVVAAEDTGGKLKPIFWGDCAVKPMFCVKGELLKDGDGDVMPSWAACNKKPVRTCFADVEMVNKFWRLNLHHLLIWLRFSSSGSRRNWWPRIVRTRRRHDCSWRRGRCTPWIDSSRCNSSNNLSELSTKSFTSYYRVENGSKQN